ncbi:hypothetical protein BH09SUM1_BH09SUM1_15560 [soil metagenome]
MDPKQLLMIMAERLYQDIKFVTEQNPTQIVDEDGTRCFNALLMKTRKHYPFVENVADFVEWSPRTIKYKDALVASGQMAAMLRALAGPDRPMMQGVTSIPSSISPAQLGGPQSTPSPDGRPGTPVKQRSHDEELYGQANPPKRNEDGTIPFSLE